MASNSTVKVTIAADATSLERATRQASQSLDGFSTAERAATANGERLEHQLEQTGRAAKGSKELMRGAGDAAVLFGGELGNTALQAGLALGAIKDLSKGSAALAKNLGVVKIATGGVIAAIATAGAALSAHIDHTSILNEVERTAADTGYYLAKGVQSVANVIPGVNTNLGGLVGWLDHASKSAHGLTDAAAEAAAALQTMIAAENAQRRAGTFGVTDTNPGGDAFADPNVDYNTSAFDPTPVKAKVTAIRAGGSSVANAVKSAAADAKAAAQKAAQDLKDAKRTVADAVNGIVDAFKPKLDTTKTLGLQVGGAGASGGLIANLKKQADDTLKLRKDLEVLDKAGLDKGLLSNLVAGGLDSLPAAEELVRNRGEIKLANSYAGKINTRSNTIAAEETARNLTKKDKQELKINISGDSADLVAVIRKWVKNNGGNTQSVLGSN